MDGAEGGTRTPTSCLTRPSNVRVCQFRHFGLSCQITIVTQTVSLRGPSSPLPAYFGEPAGEALVVAACEAAGEAAGTSLAAGEATGAGVGVASGTVDCKTEWDPVIPGRDSISAKSMKPAAAPIVIFDRMLAVPRGPNAVLETLLENRSPAPDLPGCRSTTITSTTHDRINSPYKM
jgi:hypothetical protein